MHEIARLEIVQCMHEYVQSVLDGTSDIANDRRRCK